LQITFSRQSSKIAALGFTIERSGKGLVAEASKQSFI
jgi:hypothetical protein